MNFLKNDKWRKWSFLSVQLLDQKLFCGYVEKEKEEKKKERKKMRKNDLKRYSVMIKTKWKKRFAFKCLREMFNIASKWRVLKIKERYIEIKQTDREREKERQNR